MVCSPLGPRTAVVTGMLRTEDHRRKTEAFSTMFPQYCEGGVVTEVIEEHEDEDETFEKCLNLAPEDVPTSPDCM